MEEIWKDVEGYEGLYRVSNFGRIYGVKSKTILKPRKARNTDTVYLSKGGMDRHLAVCRIVAQAFVCNKYNYENVRHLDGNNENNRADNLMWVPRTIYNVGVVDVHNIDYDHDPSFIAWKGMIWRCYCSDDNTAKWYQDCNVCDEWLVFSNFNKWFKEQSDYKDGYCLDKDILVKGNKVYSPETCCFVPHEINTAILVRKGTTYDLPHGVTYDKRNGKYIGHGTHCKRKYFDNPNDAHAYFKEKKEKYVKYIAKKYYTEGKISKNVYESLINFTVE